MSGPFETERQARELPEVRAVYVAAHASTRRGVLAEGSRRLLGQALEAAGVSMGRYDDRIAEWLSGWEPQMCAVVAGWVTRAAAGRDVTAALPAGAVTLSGDDLMTVLGALRDGARWHDIPGGEPRLAARYRSLGRSLGDDL